MKQTVRTSRTAGYLEKIFRSLNADSFNGELEEPVITIQDTPTAYGHVTVSKAWSVKGEHQRELNIAAGTLQRPIEEVAATMLHEMVHLYNLQHEIQDCSRGGTYHNKKFRDEAQKHMCMERRALVPFFVAHTPVIKLLELLQNLTDSSMIQAMFRRVIDRQEPFPALRIVFSHLLHSPLLMLQHVTKCWKPWKH